MILEERPYIGKRRTGLPQLRFSDVSKRDMKALNIDFRDWKDLAADRSKWRATQFKWGPT